MSTYTRRAELARSNKLEGILPPHEKQIEVLSWLLAPDPNNVKLVDLVCGRGFGKTTLAIVIAVYCLSLSSEQCGLFLEPERDKMNKVFRHSWRKHVPRHLYTEIKSEKMIIWHNGATLYYDHRDIYGSLEERRDRGRGPNYSWVISDEEAIRTDIQQYTNLLAAIRLSGPIRFYLTLTTPKIGEYQQLITMKRHKVFTGTSHDNKYLPPGFIEQLMESMSRDQIRREIYAEFVALEGRIWKEIDLDTKWPEGNVHYGLSEFDPKRPWWLFCDLGSATGAFVVVQQVPAVYYGEKIFEGSVWVAVADLCPYHDGSAVRAFNILKENFGTPVMVTGGKDINSRSSGDGRTIAYHARKVWPNVRIMPVDERADDRTIQFDRLSYLICSGDNNRRFCLAKNFKELEPEGRRGLKQMFETDVWPDEPSSAREFLPKDKKIRVQHVRDAVLNGSVAVMAPPTWMYNKERTK